MSKRVANTRSKTVRNGRIRYSWRREAYKSTMKMEIRKDRIADITKINPKVTTWQKIKNYIRRRCGKQ